MADIEQALYVKVTGTAAIAALIGLRLYPGRIPQESALPAILYFKATGDRVHSLAGPSGLADPTFQFDIYASGSGGYKVCKNVARELRLALDGYRGSVSGVNIQGIILDSEQDMYEEEPELFRVSMDFRVWHQE